VIRPPGQGGLYLGGGPANIFQRLTANATFTQVDILSGQLKYKLAGMLYGSGAPSIFYKDHYNYRSSQSHYSPQEIPHNGALSNDLLKCGRDYFILFSNCRFKLKETLPRNIFFIIFLSPSSLFCEEGLLYMDPIG